MNLGNKGNEYQKAISSIFDRCPKTVLAAIAVSYALRVVDEDLTKVEAELLNEWRCLNQAGIVPQKPINR